MPAATRARIFHLGWRANGDGFDVALAFHRLLAAGERGWWLTRGGQGAEAGDYLVLTSPERCAALARIGVSLEPWSGALPDDASPLAAPRVRLFAGVASKYPYFAYYALCLLRLGIDYVPCDGASLARGTLDDANLLILPGGFATWGIDAAEDAPGADARVRAFLARGGAAIGSCGGAFYLSAGRPGWTGTANARPLYTHEYLQSGVGVVAIALAQGPLAFGCPPTIEVPYYHGPLYDLLGEGIGVAATFHDLVLPGRLAIDNPLDRERFEREMKGKPAALLASGERGRAVLFSPHPEMGDLLRKYIALDGYVRHYLPIRGAATMRDTLRHYRVADAPSFRLVKNAVHVLLQNGPDDAHPSRPGDDATRAAQTDRAMADDPRSALQRAFERLPDFESDPAAEVLRDVASRIDARLTRLAQVQKGDGDARTSASAVQASWPHLAAAIAGHAYDEAPTLAQRLMELDLGVSLLECRARIADVDRVLAQR